MKVLLSGGGTAGHVNPALAAADHLKRTKHAEILFIGTERGMESRLVPEAGFPISYIEVSGLIRRLTLKNFAVLAQCITAYKRAKKMIKEFQPDVVIATGGYVCAPVVFAAHSLKIPVVIHEQNVIPGVTVKLAAAQADKICISFPETKSHLKPGYEEKCVLTGNPIRKSLFQIDREEARAQLGLDNRPFVVAFGGSLGADRLNAAVTELLNTTDTSSFQLLLGTGQRYYEQVNQQVKNQGTNIRIEPYINRMDLVLAAADVVIGRAGALTVSELSALGKPAILIPSPNVAHDHQTYNAKSLEKAGAALVIPEAELCGSRLEKALRDIIAHPEQQARMAENARRIGITDGTERICDAACALLS
ncbi:MAG: undecaprenyldiphospho-muramoylpentapeptide beta-N-acetylglucosaminyltransferase [Ruminococcaceae bacterium]|nr:undecaprenyldiphospho-muramoylpentapeptide beta-N-acetylglucosaminyltransferase [Oscillospiraceae bacterium]